MKFYMQFGSYVKKLKDTYLQLINFDNLLKSFKDYADLLRPQFSFSEKNKTDLSWTKTAQQILVLSNCFIKGEQVRYFDVAKVPTSLIEQPNGGIGFIIFYVSNSFFLLKSVCVTVHFPWLSFSKLLQVWMKFDHWASMKLLLAQQK